MKSLSYFSKYAQSIQDKDTNHDDEESSRYDTEADIQLLKNAMFSKDFDRAADTSQELQNNEQLDKEIKTLGNTQDEHQHLTES